MKICKDSSLRDSINCTKQFICRHTERSEVSKSHESKTNSESMTQKRISESHRFAKSQRIANDSKVAKMDSSLTAFAQNDESYGLPRLA